MKVSFSIKNLLQFRGLKVLKTQGLSLRGTKQSLFLVAKVLIYKYKNEIATPKNRLAMTSLGSEL